LKKYLLLFLAAVVLLPLGVLADETGGRKNSASLVVEYGLDSLERRYYHPHFRFDFPFQWGNVFSEVEYHSRMNGLLQGAIDYWLSVGVQKIVREKLQFELRLNHFFKNVRDYEFRNTSYIGLRYKSASDHDAVIDSMNVQVGASPFDEVFKLEVAGGFKFEFFVNPSRRVVAGVDFESPILNGDGFFAQFWPGKMIYDIALDYEKKIGSALFAAWTNHYRLDMPVDDDLLFAASLFTGLALRNQPNFDELEQNLRYEFAVGWDFKRGLEFNGKMGLGIWKSNFMRVFTEMRTQVDAKRIRCDLRLLAGGGRTVGIRPYIDWKKDIGLDPGRDVAGEFLFGLGFFKRFL
jgi:hypothetical protein